MTDAYNRSWKRIFTQDGGWYFILSPRVQCRLCEKKLKLKVRTKSNNLDESVDQWSWPCISEAIINALPEQQRRVLPEQQQQTTQDRYLLPTHKILQNPWTLNSQNRGVPQSRSNRRRQKLTTQDRHVPHRLMALQNPWQPHTPYRWVTPS